MRIVIITMEDPLYTVPFIKEIIRHCEADVVALAIASGGRMKIGKRRSRLVYVVSLFLIMGPIGFGRSILRTGLFNIRCRLSRWIPFVKSPSLGIFAAKRKIPVFRINSPNARSFLKTLRELKPDLIINQSQYILKEELLSIPPIGVLNRHNALLPRNRGRLTPFWVLFNGDKETGVSIHFVDKGIDSGKIVVQKRFPVPKNAGFWDIVKKNYEIAPAAMLEAIDKLKRDERDLQENDDAKATYNGVPTLRDAWRYRMHRMRLIFRKQN